MSKNIVLLSDGTGNSAAKLFKTNVWRIYDALDLRDPSVQVASYDSGVGTSTFVPLALVGGAVGFGLKRNVLRLYRFLSEQYEPGDRIYAFGFSRGAFTIRALVALIADQGIIRVRADKYPTPTGPRGALPTRPASTPTRTTMTGSELRRLSKRAYQQFRHKFDHALPFVRLGRMLRDGFLRVLDRTGGRTEYVCESNHQIGDHDIVFVGLWDTVDAYGLPIDELTRGVDKWIWPLSFPELKLSTKVEKACHALSIDDERHTFHPVLWDESDEPQGEVHLDKERISQVWFAGVHANVGGGYPNDALSAVSLDWIALEARKKELRFLTEQLDHSIDKRDPLGIAYDSRRALAAYYRYNPRKIEYLTNGQVHEKGFFGASWPAPSPTVTIGRPKIHESVFTRIAAAPDFYAPIGLPPNYAVVKACGEILDVDARFETATGRAARAGAQEVVWNLVWWRRIVYFAAMAVSLAIVMWPMREAAGAIADIAARGGASRIVTFIGGFLPDIASPWVNYYAAAPVELAIGLGALGLALFLGRKLRGRIGDRMHQIWRYVLAPVPPPDLQLPEPRGVLYRARQHRYYHGSFAVFRRMVLPNAFGLLVLVYLLAGANRVVFEGLNTLGLPCERSAETVSVVPGGARDSFLTERFCRATGIEIESGVRYEARATFDAAMDGDIPVTRPGGFGPFSAGLTAWQRAWFAAGFPFKRVWRANWFAPVARVGAFGIDQIPLNAGVTEFTARSGGELFLFVNDAIAPVMYVPGQGVRFGWSSSYGNNRGTAHITITRFVVEKEGLQSSSGVGAGGR